MKPANQGRKAFKKGDLENPYPENTQENRDWQFGFNRAYFANLEKVKRREQKARTRGRKVYDRQKKTPQTVPT